jgi:hypothetical protein
MFCKFNILQNICEFPMLFQREIRTMFEHHRAMSVVQGLEKADGRDTYLRRSARRSRSRLDDAAKLGGGYR